MAQLTLFNIRRRCDALSPVTSTVFYAEGCNFRCEGCLYWEAHDTQSVFTIDVEDALKIFLDAGTNCIVLSGGNPLLQAAAFAELVRMAREKRDTGLIIYCGETQKELEEFCRRDDDVRFLVDSADTVISGRYVPSKDCGNPMVGSSNQVVDFRTPRFEGYRELYLNGPRHIEIEMDLGDRPRLSYSGVPTASQRRVFDGLAHSIANRTDIVQNDVVDTTRLTEDDVVFSVKGDIIATLSMADETIRIRLNPLEEETVDFLVDSIVDLMYAGDGHE